MPLTNSITVWMPIVVLTVLLCFALMIITVGGSSYRWIKALLAVSIYVILLITSSICHKQSRGYFMYPNKESFIANPLNHITYLWDVNYSEFNPDFADRLVRLMGENKNFIRNNPKLYERYAVPFYTEKVSKEYNRQVADKVTELVNNQN